MEVRSGSVTVFDCLVLFVMGLVSHQVRGFERRQSTLKLKIWKLHVQNNILRTIDWFDMKTGQLIITLQLFTGKIGLQTTNPVFDSTSYSNLVFILLMAILENVSGDI